MARHFTDRPCAAAGLTSYRARSPFGFIMIGASSDKGAWREAHRSTDRPHSLERWNGAAYVPVTVGSA